MLRATERGDWASDMGLPSYAMLLQDPHYERYRRRSSIRGKWPDPVEEAFHKALRWTASYQHRLNGTHRANTDQMIGRAIYEYTGQLRTGKHVSSHIQQLRRIGSRMPEASDRLTRQIVRAAAELQEADTEDTAKINQILGQIQNATFVFARRNDEIQNAAFALSQRRRTQNNQKIQARRKPRIRPEIIMLDNSVHSLFHEISRLASQNEHELSLQPLRPLGSNFLALSYVNHLFRSEVLRYIESQLSFDFSVDVTALKTFCAHVEPIHRQHVRHIAIEFVDSHASFDPSPSTTFGTYLSTNLPNLKTVFFTLIPCNPTRHDVFEYQWGQQTNDLLSNLGDLKATIILNLRWKPDCDYFEEKYVDTQGWRCIRRCEDSGEREPHAWCRPTSTAPGFYELAPRSERGCGPQE